MRRIIMVFVAVIGCALWAAGGVVVLKDGTLLEGRIQPTRDGFIVTDPSGKATPVSAADVASMQPDNKSAASGGGSTAATSADKEITDLATLRRSVATLQDPKQAIERYKTFLARSPAGQSKADAEKDLAVWQDRADRGLTRIGDQWLTPAEAAQKQKQAIGVAGDSAAMVAAGQYGAAETAIDAALKSAPANTALLYLKGVVLYRQNKLVPARKSFEAVVSAQPSNWAAHNNLAVILWQTRSQMPALAEYDKAMQADPQNQKVLDNIVEALHQLPPATIKNDVVKKLVARFEAQDAELQKTMQANGLMRLGAQWVPSDEFNAVQLARKDAADKIEQYRKEAAELPAQLNTMDQDLTIKTNAMRAMVQESAGMDAYGHIVYSSLPQHYYELRAEVEKTSADRALKQRRLDQLPKLMADAQKVLTASQDRYTGKQAIAEAEGMPGAEHPATTQPTGERK